MRHFLSLQDFSKDEILQIAQLALRHKRDYQNNQFPKTLANQTLAMIFEKSSTRTRVSLETAMFHLGGHSIFLSTRDIQLGRGESIADTAQVLSRMCQFISIRTTGHERIEEFAQHSSVPIINTLSDLYHPTQLIADLITIMENDKLEEKICYIGDGNNVSNSLVLLASKLGLSLNIASPQGYEIPSAVQQLANDNANQNQAKIKYCSTAQEAIKNAGVVITDTFVSMGQEDEKEAREQAFKDHCVTNDLFAQAQKDAIFLHCLPAYRGKEVHSEIIDGAQSRVFDEAENRMHANKGILTWLQQHKE